MSSVKAVTEDIEFSVKVASFRPLPADKLIQEFSKWIEQQGKEGNFLVFSCSLQGLAKEYQ
jgi:hypothetical protein